MNKHPLYPEIGPFNTGTLKVSDLHTIFYEEAGNPRGKPALFLHGGPGVGILPDYRRFFDPECYRIILPDQRGAGRSTPHAELRENTTWDIVADLEKLRNHLGIKKWIVMGGSWGSTLALSYAIKHPGSILGLIIRGVFLARPSEIKWLHQEGGASTIFPDEWEKYIAPIPLEEQSNTLKAYYKILTGDNEAAKKEAAKAWARWEASIMTLIPHQKSIEEMTTDSTAFSIARIECHYTLNNFFMTSDNYLLDTIDTIRDIPCRIVQGRYDMICPIISAWELHKTLPGSTLRIVRDGSHSPMDPGMIHELIQASENFKALY
ncbi:MAG: prolyl aminopeptidase [Candidatus Brocadiaceae bacterium]|nr:prolyl aminopeptidase [Candidatus Brocadiaceae bacterium]